MRPYWPILLTDQDLLGMQGTTGHSCSERISPEVLGSSHLSLSRVIVLHHHQAESCLLTNSCSFTSRKGRCETLSRSFMPCVFSFSVCLCLPFCPCCCFLTALTLFSATTSARKHVGSFSDQIWHREKSTASNVLSTRQSSHLESTDKPMNSFHRRLFCPLTWEGTETSLKTWE